MNNEDIIKKIYTLALHLSRAPHKNEINRENGFEVCFTTLNNRGIFLKDFKFNIFFYNNNPKKCKKCNKIIEYKYRVNSFCSRTCAAINNNREKNNSTKIIKNRESKKALRNSFNCKFCFIALKNTSNKMFCSNKCCGNYRFMENFLVWYYNEGDYVAKRETIKQFVELSEGYKCKECGISEYKGKKLSLHLEHIDGKWQNNRKDNLCLLCPNCHSQTSTYKGKNIGNGNPKRRERYHKKKSY